MTDTEKFYQTIADLESGKVRVAEKVDGEWKVNSWVKEVILSGFRLGARPTMIASTPNSSKQRLACSGVVTSP